MNYSALFFKRKLGFVSLVVLASLACVDKGFAMDKDPEQPKYNPQKSSAQSGEQPKDQTEENKQKAIELYNSAVKLKDAAQAFKLFQQSMELGHWIAKREVARALSIGHGVTQDEQKAFQLFKELVVEAPNNDNYKNLGGMYMAGKGVPKNQVSGIHWLLLGKSESRRPIILSSFSFIPPSSDYSSLSILLNNIKQAATRLEIQDLETCLSKINSQPSELTKEEMDATLKPQYDLLEHLKQVQKMALDLVNVYESAPAVGFMVPGVSLFPYLKEDYSNQSDIKQFTLTLGKNKNYPCATFGEDNIKRQEKFEELRKQLLDKTSVHSNSLCYAAQSCPLLLPLPYPEVEVAEEMPDEKLCGLHEKEKLAALSLEERLALYARFIGRQLEKEEIHAITNLYKKDEFYHLARRADKKLSNIFLNTNSLNCSPNISGWNNFIAEYGNYLFSQPIPKIEKAFMFMNGQNFTLTGFEIKQIIEGSQALKDAKNKKRVWRNVYISGYDLNTHHNVAPLRKGLIDNKDYDVRYFHEDNIWKVLLHKDGDRVKSSTSSGMGTIRGDWWSHVFSLAGYPNW